MLHKKLMASRIVEAEATGLGGEMRARFYLRLLDEGEWRLRSRYRANFPGKRFPYLRRRRCVAMCATKRKKK